jgi:hypothetical protein
VLKNGLKPLQAPLASFCPSRQTIKTKAHAAHVSPADLALPPPREGSYAEADGQLLDEVATPDPEGRHA